MLEYDASTSLVGVSTEWSARNSNIVLEVVARTLDAATIQNRIAGLRSNLDKQVQWANSDLENHLVSAKIQLRTRLEARKERILADRELEQALDIPMVSTGAPRIPIRAQRKQVSLHERGDKSRGFTPEPAIEEADYQAILEQVQGWARSLERTPQTAEKLDEEELRDLLLGTLNGFWMGAAGGEFFNGAGKTDILVRHNDRNAFIGELKIWKGPSTVESTIDQLLSYLVWRDSKAAIVMFIKRTDPTKTVVTLHSAVEDHPRYVLTRDGGDPRYQVQYVFTADEEGRRVSLAVIPVVV